MHAACVPFTIQAGRLDAFLQPGRRRFGGCTGGAQPGRQPPTKVVPDRDGARTDQRVGPAGSRTMHRKPIWLVELSVGCAWRAAGR